MIAIFIDTTSNKEITVGVTINGEKFFVTKALERQKAQVVLTLLKELLQKQGYTLSDVTAIAVKPGPGSFTGVRVGVSVANALSFALGIPVNGINIAKEEKVVEPIY